MQLGVMVEMETSCPRRRRGHCQLDFITRGVAPMAVDVAGAAPVSCFSVGGSSLKQRLAFPVLVPLVLVTIC